MANPNGKQKRGKDLGNATENETRQDAAPEGGSPIPEFDDEGRLVPGTERVTEEESLLAEAYPDGGAPSRKKF